jgi:hypothetical protein
MALPMRIAAMYSSQRRAVIANDFCGMNRRRREARVRRMDIEAARPDLQACLWRTSRALFVSQSYQRINTRGPACRQIRRE